MNMELPRALACADIQIAKTRPTLYVETKRPSYATLLYYHNDLDIDDLSDEIADVVLHHLSAAKSGALEGRDLLDHIDHRMLIELNRLANDVMVLPTKIWLG